ncbi:hypothetical protein Z043_109738 [Scleropages formosus]|uniref:C-type lectin domain-containing protein n=1 Tax=Scleropages formosus TaxID=113540 RepID=A0A0P7X9R7_SCLFO|nr:hypothetical protein Z043_109738 [Scleropages formosus]
MKKSALTTFLIAGLCASTLSLVTEHFFVSNKMNWVEAQGNCRKQYTDLSSVRDEQEMEQILQTLGNQGTGWIGLYRTLNSDKWLWSEGGNSTYRKWASGQPNNYFGENCVKVENGWWNDYFCGVHLPSFCSQEMRKMVVVQETMTWEEALVYCRTNYKDLVSLLSQKELIVAQQKIGVAQGTYWWTGLRYLGDRWMWVNGDTLNWTSLQLAQCPVKPFHCWALSSNPTGDNRFCEEQLGFICLAE